MAEISGLALGTVALASLFSTCVDLFECFEAARNQPADYQLACTKIALLKARFMKWSGSLETLLSENEKDEPTHFTTTEEDAVRRSLLGIKDVFESAADLSARYCVPAKRFTWSSTSSSRRASKCDIVADANGSFVNFNHNRRPTWKSSLRRRTSWAVCDKQKLDQVIDDLDFLIRNLERVATRRMSSQSSGLTRELPDEFEICTISSTESLQSGNDITHSQTAMTSNNENAKAALASLNQLNPAAVHGLNGSIYAAPLNLKHNKNVQVGNIGCDKTRHIYLGPLNCENSEGIQLGNKSTAAYELEQKQRLEKVNSQGSTSSSSSQ